MNDASQPDFQDIITRRLNEHQTALDGFFTAEMPQVIALAEKIARTLSNGNRLLVCGNGGSACDAQHIAGEFVGRFETERRGLPAIALSADSGILTAVGNDYGFESIFSRQIEALGNEGDIVIGMSTSGSSPNILKALCTGREKKLYTVLLTGEKGRSQQDKADLVLVVPSTVTAHIQEVHMVLLHLLAGMVDLQLQKEG
jgi:D-sedoheptulose 7-phosphate isomerase